MNPRTQALLGLNISIIVMSMAGLFAKLIVWPAPVTIFGRMALSSVFLVFYLLFRRISLRIKRRDILPFIGLGAILAAHWVTYFSSIQASTVAIGIIAVFTSPIITTFLEPLFDGKRLSFADVLLALFAFSGIVFMNSETDPDVHISLGIGLGILSAFLVSLRNIWSKYIMKEYKPSKVLFWQMTFGSLFLLPLLPFYTVHVSMIDLRNIVILSLFATAFAHSLMLHSIHHIGARSTSVLMMTQPVYAIVLAAILLQEIPSYTVLLGGSIVISSSIIENIRQSTLKE